MSAPPLPTSSGTATGGAVRPRGRSAVKSCPATSREAAAIGAGVQKGVVAPEMPAANDALGEVAALQRRDLRRQEARGAVDVALALLEIEHVALEAELDR